MASRSETEEPDDAGPGDRDEGTGRLIAIGMVVGLLVAVAVGIGLGGDRSRSAPTGTNVGSAAGAVVTTEPGTGEVGAPADATDLAVDLIEAWAAGRIVDHHLVGTLRRGEQTPVDVRRTVLGGRRLDQVGATALVVRADEARQCDRIDGVWLCSDPVDAVTTGEEARRFAALFLVEPPAYVVLGGPSAPPDDLAVPDRDARCWDLIAAGGRSRDPYGSEATICLDTATGVVSGQRTRVGERTDVFVASTITTEIDEADLDPSP